MRTAQKGPAGVWGTVEPLFRASGKRELPRLALTIKDALEILAIDFGVGMSGVRTSRNINMDVRTR